MTITEAWTNAIFETLFEYLQVHDLNENFLNFEENNNNFEHAG